jgi:entericidin B
MNSKILTLLTVVTATLSLSACNTIEGAGQDIQKGGQSIEKAADTSK